MISKVNPLLFDWVVWRNGSPLNVIGMQLRGHLLDYCRFDLKKYAIGYCDGETLVCRPKRNHKAVMFFKDNEYYWFHLTNKEFEEIYENIN